MKIYVPDNIYRIKNMVREKDVAPYITSEVDIIKMPQSVGFALLVLACFTRSACACSCFPSTWKEMFCNGDFAIAIKVKDSEVIKGDIRVYDVDVLKTYRTVPVKNLITDKIYTSVESSFCGVNFEKDAYYVISGYYKVPKGQPSRMRAHLCGLKLYFLKKDPTLTFNPPECEREESEKELADVEAKEDRNE